MASWLVPHRGHARLLKCSRRRALEIKPHPQSAEEAARRGVEALEGDADGDQKATDTAVRILPLILRMDDAFGLTPAAAAKLHYAFVADEPAQEMPTSAGVTDIRNRLKNMRD